MTNPNQLPIAPYYDASQQPSTEQHKYAPIPAVHYPGPPTSSGNCSGGTIYAPLAPSYTEHIPDPTSNEPTQPVTAEKPEEDQLTPKPRENPIPVIIISILVLAIMGAILYGVMVGMTKLHNKTYKVRYLTQAPSQTTATRRFTPPSGISYVTLVGPSTTAVGYVGVGPNGPPRGWTVVG
jgi:hypothetical protein